jgi:hypothetical protein
MTMMELEEEGFGAAGIIWMTILIIPFVIIMGISWIDEIIKRK